MRAQPICIKTVLHFIILQFINTIVLHFAAFTNPVRHTNINYWPLKPSECRNMYRFIIKSAMFGLTAPV